MHSLGIHCIGASMKDLGSESYPYANCSWGPATFLLSAAVDPMPPVRPKIP